VLSYRREGGWPPPDHELLEIQDDGSFTLWRTIGRASQPPAPIGGFKGTLTEGERSDLQGLLNRIHQAADIRMPFPPDSAVETIMAAGRTALLPHTGMPGEPWAGLVALARTLLVQLTDRPRAALGLRLTDAGKRVDLVLLGDRSLLVDLSRVSVRAILWSGYEQLGTWESGQLQLGPGPAQLQPGWSRELPFSHGLNETSTAQIRAYVDLRLHNSGGWLEGSLQTP
jgi:hypothetical protein